MGTTLATKQDLESVRLATKQDLESMRLATKQDIEALRVAAKQDLELLKRDMENRFALVDQRFDTLELRLVVKLGSMMIAGFGLTIAALRLWA